MKPREFWIDFQEQVVFVIPVENCIRVREVIPIDWDKLWKEVVWLDATKYSLIKKQIQELVEKQLVGEE